MKEEKELVMWTSGGRVQVAGNASAKAMMQKRT